MTSAPIEIYLSQLQLVYVLLLHVHLNKTEDESSFFPFMPLVFGRSLSVSARSLLLDEHWRGENGKARGINVFLLCMVAHAGR